MLNLTGLIGFGAGGAVFSATGGTITTDGAYTVHTFTSSGTFTVLSGAITAEVAVVGGGGSGGCIDNYGCGGITGWSYGAGGAANSNGSVGPNYSPGTQNSAGGGGGGACAQWASLFINSSKSVTVGTGGTAGSNNATASVFDTVTSNGGSKGGNAPSHVSTGGAGGAKGTGTGGSTTPGSISIGSYGIGGHGASQGWGAQAGTNGVVIVRYLTNG
jgi:hypothetical protein